MLRTLLYIPNEDVIGIPVFGLGWLLMAWGVFSIVLWIWLLRTQRSQREVWGHVPLLVLVAAVIWFLLPRLCQPIPGGGELKGLPIHAWGMMVLVALTSAVGVAAWRGRRLGIDPEVIFTLAFWVVVPGIIGARAFYVIEYWEHFRRQTFGQTVMAVINVTQGGLVVYGSFMGAVVGLVGFFHKYKMPRLATLDSIAPSLMLGVAIGRVGCFLNGCCFGGICELPWAVTFPSSPTPSPAYIYQVQHGDIFLQGLKIVGDPSKDPVITEVQPGSAAEKQGLEPGQRVVSINGQLMGTVEQAQWMLMNAQRAENRIVIRTHGSASVAEWPVTGPPPRSEPVHPTQLYSSLNGLLLFPSRSPSNRTQDAKKDYRSNMMTRILIASIAVLVIAVPSTMAGRGGGNFYVPALVAAGQSMHQAATTAQLVLFLTACAGMLIFQKHKLVDWKLALGIDPPTDVMALAGGYLAHLAAGIALKLVLAGLLVLAGFLMLMKVRDRPVSRKRRFGFWHRHFAGHEYVVNLWLAIPITAATGVAAGALGISGGSFKVPLMVLLCGVPMRVAVGTSSAMVAATALMGFIGHAAGGDFQPNWAVPIASAGVAGGLIGAKLALKTKSRNLKHLFAWTTLAAAAFMMANAALSE